MSTERLPEKLKACLDEGGLCPFCDEYPWGVTRDQFEDALCPAANGGEAKRCAGMGDFREAYRSTDGRHLVWTEGGVQDARVAEVTLFGRDGEREWRAKLPYRDDSFHKADKLLPVLDAEVATLQKMAAFIRAKEAEHAGPSETLGDRIRRLRAHHGYKLRKLAEQTGISASTLCQIERGNVPGWGVGVGKFQALARAFGMTMDEFADGLEMPG